jgi:hypothetical protein
MAHVRLGRFEVEDYDLPRVCMRCGAPATVYKRNKFKWHPPWAFLFLGAIGAMIFGKTMTVPVPLCPKHKWHWTGRAALVGFTLPLIPIFFIAWAIVASQFSERGSVLFMPSLVVFLAWLIMAIVLLRLTGIRPAEITDKSITLTGVSEEFIRALEADRRGDGERIDRDERPRTSRRQRDQDDDGGYYDPDESKPRRRPPPDAIEEGDDR